MGFFDWFSPPKPAAVIIIRDVLGEEIDRVPARDLYNQDLRGKQWMHPDLSGMSLFGANLEGANLFGARLYRTDFQKVSLRGAELRVQLRRRCKFSTHGSAGVLSLSS